MTPVASLADIPEIVDSQYDDLFVVTVYAPGRAKVVQLKYGS